ncbi:MAG: AbrB/MazE/SpoVT family DNA-binding domain-containing protein [Planctomycetes bacterium]|nr:AbrB/MazE/SpoVT family DNA-binding domain-containing protein [Planctomycetota bacterium]
MKTVIDSCGRILLPADLQTQIGVRPGDEVVLESRAGEWVIRSAVPETGLVWEGDVLVHRGTMLPEIAHGDVLQEMRDERLQQQMTDIPR